MDILIKDLMRTNAKSRGFFLTLFLLMLGTTTKAQVGHVLQGVGGVNMSMGGAATAQPLDINGALLWNPASLSKFDGQILSFNAGLFFSDPSISSTVPTQNGPFSGTTGDDRGVSVLPALAYVWGKDESKHTFGISAFGVSGFGVTFPESQDNPITMPQSSGGFGHIESDYALLQLSFAYSYQLTDKISLGIQPNFNYATLEIGPNPLAAPSQTLGYPNSDKATAFGIGAQFGLFYDSGSGLKIGASYKSKQIFNDFSFNNTYLDGSEAPDVDFNILIVDCEGYLETFYFENVEFFKTLDKIILEADEIERCDYEKVFAEFKKQGFTQIEKIKEPTCNNMYHYVFDRQKESLLFCSLSDRPLLSGPMFKTLKQYCDRHKYKCVLEDNVLDSDRAASWSKIKLLQREMKANPDIDTLVWIDDDILITREDIRFEELIKPYPFEHILVSADVVWSPFNCGVLVVKNDESTYRLLQYIWDMCEEEEYKYFKFIIHGIFLSLK